MSPLIGIVINAGLCIYYLSHMFAVPGVVDTIAFGVCSLLCVIAAWMFVADARTARGVLR